MNSLLAQKCLWLVVTLFVISSSKILQSILSVRTFIEKRALWGQQRNFLRQFYNTEPLKRLHEILWGIFLWDPIWNSWCISKLGIWNIEILFYKSSLRPYIIRNLVNLCVQANNQWLNLSYLMSIGTFERFIDLAFGWLLLLSSEIHWKLPSYLTKLTSFSPPPCRPQNYKNIQESLLEPIVFSFTSLALWANTFINQFFV